MRYRYGVYDYSAVCNNTRTRRIVINLVIRFRAGPSFVCSRTGIRGRHSNNLQKHDCKNNNARNIPNLRLISMYLFSRQGDRFGTCTNTLHG